MDHTKSTYESSLAQKVYELVRFNDAKGLKELDKTNCPLLIRDENQETPLSICLRDEPSDGVVPKEDIIETLQALLGKGAAESIFVKGYKPASLVCVLPMAEQPESSYISWPKPIKIDNERLAMLDKALADHIKKMFNDELRQKNLDSSTISSNNPQPTQKSTIPKPAFNHYPADLKVGDFVRRGPDWSYSNQDERSSIRHAGIVTSVDASQHNIDVTWYTDVKDSSTGFGSYSYAYHPGSKVDLYLVNPSNLKAVPKNINSASLAGDRFQVGDKVRLAAGRFESSLIHKNKPHLVEVSKLCLGTWMDSRVGVIVESESPITTQLDNCVVKVMELKSGKMCEYSMTDLRYADGSGGGIPKAGIISPLPIEGVPNTQPATGPTFKIGDIVMLKPHVKNHRGCLYKPSLGLTGFITSVSGINIQVHSKEVERNSAWSSAVSGNYPNHTYNASELMLVGGNREPLALLQGDLVELNSAFTNNNGVGWCLGTLADPKKGVVRFATVPSNSGGDQREVVVSSVDEPHKKYNFKSSWLQRATNDGHTKFKIGDRVRLDISTWTDGSVETAGKCLGLPRSGYYGLVCALGPTRDGIQRNIEVIAASGPKINQVSLYPAYSIHHATRVSVLTDSDIVALSDTISQLFEGTNFQTMDCAKLIEKSGQNIWNTLSTVPVFTRSKLHSAWLKWDLRRSLSWPRDEPNVYEKSFGYRMIQSTQPINSAPILPEKSSEALAAKVEPTATWKCKSKKCLIAGGFENEITVNKCGVCKASAPKWSCEYCTSKNTITSLSCISCYITKSESDELNVDFIRKKKEDEIAKKKQRDQEIQSRVDLINAEGDKLCEKAGSVVAPLFLHPGSFVGCGGNPEGFARCDGNGVCSVGVDCCINCGAGTHWSCCGSTDSESIHCPASQIENAQKKAGRNAKILSLLSTKLTPISRVKGYFPFVPSPTWFCEACTVSNANDDTITKCSLCDTDRPTLQLYDDIWKELASIDIADELEVDDDDLLDTVDDATDDQMVIETEGEESPEEVRYRVETRLKELYSEYDRRNLSKISILLQKYMGRESKLLQAVEKRFGISPLLTHVPASDYTFNGGSTADSSALKTPGARPARRLLNSKRNLNPPHAPVSTVPVTFGGFGVPPFVASPTTAPFGASPSGFGGFTSTPVPTTAPFTTSPSGFGILSVAPALSTTSPSGFGVAPAPSVTSSSGFSFGVASATAPPTTSPGGFSFGVTSTPIAAPSATSPSLFGGFGVTPAPSATSPGGFGVAPATAPSTTSPGGFGGFAPAPSTTSSSGFGGFGVAPATAPSVTSPGGFGGFGVAPAPSTTSPGGFGVAPTAAPSTTSSGGFGGFGVAPATASSVTSLGGFGGTISVPTSLFPTSSTPFVPEVTTEAGRPGVAAARMNIQVITAMPVFSNKSLEELRLDDLKLGVKGPVATSTAALTTPAFGVTPPTPAFGAVATPFKSPPVAVLPPTTSFTAPPVSTIDATAVRCKVGHVMHPVDPKAFSSFYCDCNTSACVSKPVHYKCQENSCSYDMCKPCYKFKQSQLKPVGNPFGFSGPVIIRVTEPLTRLASAIANESDAAKIEKDSNIQLLYGSEIQSITEPATISVPTAASISTQEVTKSNTIKCSIVISSFNLGVTNGPIDDPSNATRSCRTGTIVRYLPETIVQVEKNIKTKRAQLSDQSGWISVEVNGASTVREYVEDASDSEDEDLNENDDVDNDCSDEIQSPKVIIPDDLEIIQNTKFDEEYFSTSFNESSFDTICEGGDLLSGNNSDSLELRGSLRNQSSMGFFKMGHYEAISEIRQLITFADKNGNTSAHYAANLGLTLTLAELVNAGADLWKKNIFSDTPSSLQFMALNSSIEKNALFTSIYRRGLLPTEAVHAALKCSFTYTPSSEFDSFIQSVKEDVNENDACYFAEDAIHREVPHALLYRAVFRLLFSYGPLLAKQDMDLYLKEVMIPSEGIADRKPSFIDPLYYYCMYLLWKRPSGGRPSHNKSDRLRAFDAIRALRQFPAVYDEWMDPKETLEKEIEESGIANIIIADVDEDDYSDILPPPSPDDPEMVWERAKTHYKLKSPSLDLLMQMIGLKDVKERAISVALTVLLSPPPDLKCQTSMNFLFVGNPGCGKTSVATFLAQAMAELGFRKNPAPVITSAETILSAQDPLDEFLNNVKAADGGTLVIDEAYLFDPAPKGKSGNDSNKVLDTLMKVSESMKLTTTFILCGYKEEILQLLTYNPGFDSRFPKTFRFEFSDYTELQLTKILADMTKQRNFRFESKKECGIPIARVLARRIYRGANKKGFGNGRACEKELENCIQKQQGRLVKLKLAHAIITDYDYRTLTRGDTVGERPHLEDSPYMAELNAMVGLKQVKECMQNLMNLQLRNYDAEMRGEAPQLISLHRVFLGNPGTGKTTVARLYGKMLKEFGFLSDGDFIMTTPSDLKGSAVGEAAERTRALLDSAKGKILFIDEAYNLDPKRHAGGYGAEVIDTILEKIEANAGSDMALIMAGYKPQMDQFFRNANNEGLKRRLNLSEAFFFEDFTDEDIKKVLKMQIVNTGFTCEPSTLDFAVRTISKKRMEEGFGNAGEAEQILTRAKLRLSARVSKMLAGSVVNMKLLIDDDFAGEETSAEKAREAFAGLENMEHVEYIVDKLEAMVATATEEGKKPHEEMANMHMLFLGPPGTGKTTCGKRFATMLKQLEVLPSDRFEYTTAGQLIDRYVGGTSNNTTEAMRRAKGGILFIDEAYGMLPSKGNWFGGEIMQALLDNVTSEEYKGKIVVILGGYKEHVEELFAVNPGFQSRFDKIRVEFPEWTGDQAAKAVVNSIVKDGKTITEEAVAALPAYFNSMRELPNWASARDAMELIRPALEVERASRSFVLSKERRLLEDALSSHEQSASGKSLTAGPVGRVNSKLQSKAAKKALPPPISYELCDVLKVFENAINARGGEFSTSIPASTSSNQDASAEIGSSLVKRLKNKIGFTSAVQKTNSEKVKLLVVCFTSPESCHYCRTFAPKFASLAATMTSLEYTVEFASIEDQEVHQMNGVNAVPCTRIYYRGKPLGAEVRGDNEAGLQSEILRQIATISKMKSNAPPPPMLTAPPDGQMGGPPPPPKIKHNFKVKTRDNEDDDDSNDSFDVWAALEEACAELGWSLQQIKDMLEDTANFPPQEILRLIMSSTGCDDAGKIIKMLVPQRAAVLEKVKFSIKENQRLKSAQEAKVQVALAAIGKCCMGFEWIKMEGGYRCAGGSHFCTDAEVNKQMLNNN